MLITAHIEKFRRLNAMTRRLDPETDRELWLWTAMNAATHLLNAALHHAGLTQEIDSFHSQVEGLYCVPDRTTGRLTDAMHPLGDVMHFGQPPLDQRIAPAIERAGAALKVIQDLRRPYVRGNDPISSGATHQWEGAYRECVDQLSTVLEMRLGQAE